MEIIRITIVGDEYRCDIPISMEEWIEILQNEKLTTGNYKETLLRFYNEPGHKSTCKALGEKYGKDPQSFNRTITSFAEAVQKNLNRFKVIGTENQEVFWAIPMLGRRLGGLFEWIVRPELAEAIERTWLNATTDPIRLMIERYKEHIKENGLKDEIYKWELVQKYKGRPDVNAQDFTSEIRTLDFSNLAYYMTKAVANELAEKEPEKYRVAFKSLFDEKDPINERIKAFKGEIKHMYASIGGTLSSHHSERAIATFLTFHNPKKYTFYMPKIYNPYCKMLGIKPTKTGEKYVHYLELISELIDNYIMTDNELLHMVDNELGKSNTYPDKDRKILAQDILYHNQRFESKAMETKTMEKVITENKIVNKIMNSQPLNQILYGPPGTGKTFHTINKAVEIIRPDFDVASDRRQMRNIFNELVEQGQIVFTTFHQSMTYEDFVEGIKPVLNEESNQSLEYRIEDGIFKRLSYLAKYEMVRARKMIQNRYSREELFEIAYNELITDVEEHLDNNSEYGILTRTGLKVYIHTVSEQQNLHIRHQNSIRELPHIVSKQRVRKLFLHFNSIEEITNINQDIRAVIGGANATTYWGVLSNLLDRAKKIEKSRTKVEENPVATTNYENIKSIVSSAPVNDLVDVANIKKYVLIIDEINRGNISQIFGELITLIEDDKRLGCDEALEVTLPYSKEKFGVPANLYIIGTMNTADRSVEALDTALRRRFSFEERQSSSRTIREQGALRETNGVLEDIDLGKLMDIINQRVEVLLDKDHQIGHSYFLRINSIEGLKTAFYNKIIPLLQEYFYGDYGKIGLVLGKGFVTLTQHDNNRKLFAPFYPEYDGMDYEDNPSYAIANPLEMDDSEFRKAVKVLMNIEK